GVALMRKLFVSLLGSALLVFPLLVQANPDIEHWKTPKGLKVYYLESHEIPMLDIRLVFDAGSARDGEQSGLSSLTNGELFSGTSKRDLETVARELDDVGAEYGAGSLRDMAWLELRSLSRPESLDPALEVFLDVIADPQFPRNDFERSRKQRLVALKAEEQSPSSVASKAYYRAVYGDHPYASPVSGTLESVKKIGRKNLKKFFETYYVANNAVLVIVGDMDRKQAEKLALRFDTALKAGEKAPALPEVKPLEKAVNIRMPFPSEQAHIYIGQPGMSRTDPDYFQLYVGNHVLGGSGFTSRLMKQVRSDRGLAYSVYSYFMPMRAQGPFLAGLQTRVDQADMAVDLVYETLATYRKEGPTDKELMASKRNITGGFPLRIASNGDLVEYLAVIGFYDLPLDYLDTFVAKVEAIDQKAILDAYQRRLDPDRMVTVVVGGEQK
ncbi:MAG: pitrilysin family protein, partial [Gammaproteobacteria bacterium]|nr:pitrilysin family protein [Gammaproteobacteria bacterium]